MFQRAENIETGTQGLICFQGGKDPCFWFVTGDESAVGGVRAIRVDVDPATRGPKGYRIL